jgi:hypothetical protein
MPFFYIFTMTIGKATVTTIVKKKKNQRLYMVNCHGKYHSGSQEGGKWDVKLNQKSW